MSLSAARRYAAIGMDELVRIVGLSKRFPGVQALSDVRFSIRRGECHALVGENGAGKSTLGKIIAGLYRADDGRIELAGQRVDFASPHAAAAAGVAIVHQELAYCPNLSIAENLCLGRMPRRLGFFRRAAAAHEARETLRRVGLTLDPRTPMARLSAGLTQLVQIGMALARRPRLLILDEPTSSLSAAEVARLDPIMADLRSAGVTVIFVSHRLEEIRRYCDRATILRDGHYVETVALADATNDEIVRRMIGRPLGEFLPQHTQGRRGQPRLQATDLCGPGGFANISFTLHAGEIVGMAGLVGAGRSELARALFGVDPITRGELEIEGRRVRPTSPHAAIRMGLGLLPEDRKQLGLVLGMTCRENLTLSALRQIGRGGWRRPAAELALTRQYIEQLRVRTPGPETAIAGLSGGNQQKIALAKWLACNCRVLILDEPTRGVDIAAKAEMYALIDQLAAAGKAILLISSELPELLALSTRILVMRGGRIVGEVPRAAADEESLLRLMTGTEVEAAANEA